MSYRIIPMELPTECDECHTEGVPLFVVALIDPWGGVHVDREHLCATCAKAYTEREPPEPDGEAFRGTEAARYEGEQLARCQRELKR